MIEEIDYSLTLAQGTPEMLLAGGILALSVFLVMFIVIKKRWGAAVLPFFVGFVAFTLVRMFVMLIESALMLVPSIDQAFEYNENALAVIDCILAATGYMAARWVLIKALDAKYKKQGDIMIAGLGMGFGDALLYGLTTVSNYVWCIAIDNGSLEQAFEGLSASEALTTFQSLTDLFYAQSYLWLLMGLSTAIDIVLHVLLTMVIYGVYNRQLPSMWNSISTVIYFAVVLPFQLYDAQTQGSIVACFGIKAVLFAGVIIYITRYVLKNIQFEE